MMVHSSGVLVAIALQQPPAFIASSDTSSMRPLMMVHSSGVLVLIALQQTDFVSTDCIEPQHRYTYPDKSKNLLSYTQQEVYQDDDLQSLSYSYPNTASEWKVTKGRMLEVSPEAVKTDGCWSTMRTSTCLFSSCSHCTPAAICFHCF